MSVKMSDRMEMVPIKDIHPYAKNPRKNDNAVPKVMESIQRFGFRNPIILDKDNTVIAGHTRLAAAKRLKLKEVPCIWAKDLTPDEVKALRLVDNKTNEYAEWDIEGLEMELDDIDLDLSDFDFDLKSGGFDFDNLSTKDGEKDAEYLAFEDKFKQKLTTDDCYTPPKVYEAIKGWVIATYGHTGEIVRPFYPGGDYQSFDYPKGCLVLDNPPFSIASEIIRFYEEKGIDYFLFGNQMTALQPVKNGTNVVLTGRDIVYENGADVPTAYHTNLGHSKITISGELGELIDQAQPSETADLKAYEYPDNLITMAILSRLAKYGSNFTIENIEIVKGLDDGNDIYGAAALISDVKAEKVKAEKVKAEKVKAEKVKAEKVKAEKVKIKLQLSERERTIINKLNAMEELA